MRVIGLTGGMGAGKSTVANMLHELGAHVIDADAVSREVVEPGMPALAAIVEAFGSGVLHEDGSMDRSAVAAIVFQHPPSLRALEAITHPAIRDAIAARLRQHAKDEVEEEGERFVVLDHPLLFETGLATGLEAVIVVTAPVELRIERLATHRGVDPDDARARIARQASDAQRASGATHTIVNDGDESELRTRVEEVWEDLRSA